MSDEATVQALIDAALTSLDRAHKNSNGPVADALVGIGYVLAAEFSLKMATAQQVACPREHTLGTRCELCGSK